MDASKTNESLTVRAYMPADQETVLALAKADRLPGQPEVTSTELAEALSCGTRRAELDHVAIDVVRDPDDRVRGVISHALRAGDGDGLILWLHAEKDNEAAIGVLVRHALTQLGSRPVHAFRLTTPLTPGFQGLPMRNRPAQAVMRETGFTNCDLWYYLYRPLDTAPGPSSTAYPIARVDEMNASPGWRLVMEDTDGTQMGQVLIARLVDGIATLRWIEIHPPYRGQGLASNLLQQGIEYAATQGAREMTACIEDDDSSDLVRRLCDSARLTESEQLAGFFRRP